MELIIFNDVLVYGMTMSLESPPLWVWAIIAGIIVAGKLTYRWYATKRLVKD